MDMRTTFKTANARGLKFAAGYDTKEETFVVKLTITVINPAGSQVAELAELARSGDLDLELTANQLPLPLSAR